MNLLYFKVTTPLFNWFYILLLFTIHFINLYLNVITSCYLLHLGLTSSCFPRTLRCFIRLFETSLIFFNVSTLSINFLLRTALAVSQKPSKFYCHFHLIICFFIHSPFFQWHTVHTKLYSSISKYLHSFCGLLLLLITSFIPLWSDIIHGINFYWSYDMLSSL